MIEPKDFMGVLFSKEVTDNQKRELELTYALGLALGALEGLWLKEEDGPNKAKLNMLINRLHAINGESSNRMHAEIDALKAENDSYKRLLTNVVKAHDAKCPKCSIGKPVSCECDKLNENQTDAIDAGRAALKGDAK